MYAIFESGGKQFKAEPGDFILVEKMEGDVGNQVEIDKVLMVQDDEDTKVGTPYVDNARVVAEIVKQTRGKKIRIFKRKKRKGYRKTMGHRQWLTGIKIQEIKI